MIYPKTLKKSRCSAYEQLLIEQLSILDLQRYQLTKLGVFELSRIADLGLSSATLRFQAPGKNEFVWGAICDLHGYRFSIEFTNELFYPLEQAVGQKIKLHWEDKNNRALIMEALLGQFLAHHLIASPSSGVKFDQAALDQAKIMQLFEDYQIKSVYGLAKQKVEFDQEIKDHKIQNRIDLDLAFSSGQSEQMPKAAQIRMGFSGGQWSRLICWADTLYQRAHTHSPLAQAAAIDVRILKPFNYLSVADLGSLSAGDGIYLRPSLTFCYWIQVAQSDQLLEVILPKADAEAGSEPSYRLIPSIPTTSFGESCVSLGLDLQVLAKDWMSDWKVWVCNKIKEIEQGIHSLEGAFYVNTSPAGPGAVLSYEDSLLLQMGRMSPG